MLLVTLFNVMEYTIKLSDEDFNIIKNALLELPAKMSYNILTKLAIQVSEQIKQGQTNTPPVKATKIGE